MCVCVCVCADADAAEEPGSGGRDGAGTTGRSSGRPDQLHGPSHNAHREAHLPHEKTAVAQPLVHTHVFLLRNPLQHCVTA